MFNTWKSNGVPCEKSTSLEEAREMLIEVMKNGKALEHLKSSYAAQGGDASVVDDPEKMPQAKYKIEVEAKKTVMFLKLLQMKSVTAAMLLGAGRATKEV